MSRIIIKSFRAIAFSVVSLAVAGSARAQFTPSGSSAEAAAPATPADGNSGSAVATPWSSQYGAWITPANSYWAQDDIARRQAYFQGKMQFQDMELRRLQLRRAAFDQRIYEIANTPTPEVRREEARLERLARARNSPPQEEIASGQALNELLNNIERMKAREVTTGPAILLDAETLSRLNVTTTGDSAGSNEFFKPGQFPDWPLAFSSAEFDDDKRLMDAKLKELAKAANSYKVDAANVDSARQTVESMRTKLFVARSAVAFREYVAALEYLSKLRNTIDTLGKPGARNFLDGTYAAKGNTMPELVDYMISKGLKFAKATSGYEPHYATLYQQLVGYELSMSRAVTPQQWQPSTSQRN